jgi:ABC-type nitrate/sulfonate/bicarbonate transport system permease component
LAAPVAVGQIILDGNSAAYLFTAANTTGTLTFASTTGQAAFLITSALAARSVGAVVGEYFGGPTSSLGIYITTEAGLFRYPNAWAAILLACALGIVFYLVVVAVERVVLPWHATQRESAA